MEGLELLGGRDMRPGCLGNLQGAPKGDPMWQEAKGQSSPEKAP